MGTVLLTILMLGFNTHDVQFFQVDKDLAVYLNESIPPHLAMITNHINPELVLYDSAYKQELFGFIPKEVLISEMKAGGNHIQISYEFSGSECYSNGYGPTLKIIEELSGIFGKPNEVQWLKNQIKISWRVQNLKLDLFHLELWSGEVVIVRLDMQNDRLLASK